MSWFDELVKTPVEKTGLSIANSIGNAINPPLSITPPTIAPTPNAVATPTSNSPTLSFGSTPVATKLDPLPLTKFHRDQVIMIINCSEEKWK